MLQTQTCSSISASHTSRCQAPTEFRLWKQPLCSCIPRRQTKGKEKWKIRKQRAIWEIVDTLQFYTNLIATFKMHIRAGICPNDGLSMLGFFFIVNSILEPNQPILRAHITSFYCEIKTLDVTFLFQMV